MIKFPLINTDLSKKADKINIPSKVSELENDTGYKTTDTTYEVFKPSGDNASSGLVPAPPSEEGTNKYLREDGTWEIPPSNLTIDAELSNSSTNPVQNKVIKEELDKKIDSTLISDSMEIKEKGKVADATCIKILSDDITKIKQLLGKILIQTLKQGETTIIFEDSAITESSTIKVYTDQGVDYNSIIIDEETVTIEFDAQETDMKIKLEVR